MNGPAPVFDALDKMSNTLGKMSKNAVFPRPIKGLLACG